MFPIERLLAKLPGAKKSGKGWSAPCPAHEDQHASLSIGEGDDGRALVKCHTGCTTEAICGALGMTQADLFEPRGVSTSTVFPKSPVNWQFHRQDTAQPKAKT